MPLFFAVEMFFHSVDYPHTVRYDQAKIIPRALLLLWAVTRWCQTAFALKTLLEFMYSKAEALCPSEPEGVLETRG